MRILSCANDQPPFMDKIGQTAVQAGPGLAANNRFKRLAKQGVHPICKGELYMHACTQKGVRARAFAFGGTFSTSI